MSPSAPEADWLSFRLAGWSAWTPEISNLAEWQAWVGVPDSPTGIGAVFADPAALSGMLKRRVTPLGRTALAAALGIAEIEDARYILSSRHGEFERTLSLLESLSAFETPSPTEFSMSVDHALAGLLSIASGNKKGHTAVSAGPESFGYGLMEAAACLAERQHEPVILLHFDEPPGGGFSNLITPQEREPPLVVALGMAGGLAKSGDQMKISVHARTDEAQSPSLVLDFIRFVLTGEASSASAGRRMVWRWRRG